MIDMMMSQSRHFNEKLLKESIWLVKEKYEIHKPSAWT